MRYSPRLHITVLVIALGLAAGCADSTEPDGPAGMPIATSTDGEPIELLALRNDAPMPAEETVGFWAVSGSPREGIIRFSDGMTGNGNEYVKLRVGPHALYAHPDGRRFERGDSVFITIRIVNEPEFLFEFQPAGLVFDAQHGAELTIDYAQGDVETNGGVEHQLGLWLQEQPDEAFAPIVSSRDEAGKKFRATIAGFSRYAIAY